ncbi:MAG TPA: type II toxin-antitoxin system death-on-curing family toxin [Bacillota bacterium]|nr:type II toxin-antitoxin system death-on-curing family toxin [Bacillota bacterium]
MLEIHCLTREHIEMIHEQAIEKFGGQNGHYIFTLDRIESILAQQYPYFGVDKYPGVFDKAAMLLFFFTKGHCFVDGNKRVGIGSAIVFLMINGYEDNLDDNEGYRKTLEIAGCNIEDAIIRDRYIRNLSQWLVERFKTSK